MKNRIGERFGNLTVIQLDRSEKVISKNNKSYFRTFYICQCDCGNESSVLLNALISGNTKSCGCLRINTLIAKCENLLGQVFSRLTVVSKKDGIGSFWNCICDCGVAVTVRAGDLKSDTTRSCGCLQKEKATITALQISRDYRISKGLDPDKPMLEDRVLERAKFKTLRKEIFERDSYTCVCCSVVGSRLNVHHIETWAFAPELRFDKSNLITLCVSCHKSVHKGNFNVPPDEITSILLMGYTKVIDNYQDEVIAYDLF